MRSLRSVLAITSSAPSSTFLRPIFQASVTRSENCSIVSGSVVGTISTATWLPLRASRSLSFWVRPAMSDDDNVPVWSTTRPVNCGTATSASTIVAKQTSSAASSALTAERARKMDAPLFRGCRRGRVEVDLRRDRDLALVIDGEVGLLLVAESHRGQVVREGADADVEFLHRLDVAVTRHRDAVLGAFELGHQVAEQLVRFQLRIILGDDQQPRQRAGQLALRGLELLQRGGIVDDIR